HRTTEESELPRNREAEGLDAPARIEEVPERVVGNAEVRLVEVALVARLRRRRRSRAWCWRWRWRRCRRGPRCGRDTDCRSDANGRARLHRRWVRLGQNDLLRRPQWLTRVEVANQTG